MSELVKKSEVLDIWYNYWETAQTAREAEELLKDLEAVSYDEQPPLNDNQQIVLASLKNNAEQYALRINPIACMAHLHIDSLEGGSTSAQEAYISLSNGEEAQVIEVFAKWVQEMQGE